MLGLRILSAAVLVPIALFLLFYSPETTALGTAFIALAGTYEFYKMAEQSPYKFRPSEIGGYILAVLLSYLAYVHSLLLQGVAILIYAVYAVVALWLRNYMAEHANLERTLLENWAISMFAPIYVGFPISLVTSIRSDLAAPASYWWITMAFVGTWGTDTGAMFAGMAFGKRPLAPKISPKKTIEGTIGGVLLGVIGTCLIGTLALDKPLWLCIIMGICFSVAAVLGDLFESWIKRRFKTKDSGKLIPGHGGLLDRVDGLLAVCLVVFIFVKLVG